MVYVSVFLFNYNYKNCYLFNSKKKNRVAKSSRAAKSNLEFEASKHSIFGLNQSAGSQSGSLKSKGSNSSGDKKLALSAQMYHYQHQKEQMIAIEK